jgi:hypothetical protein
MKKIYALLLLSVGIYSHAQVFEVAAIQDSGDPNKLINLVVMGDGYTAAQQPAFINKSTLITNYLFSQPPFSNYKNYFNVSAIKVISNESGAKHDNSASDCTTYPPIVPVGNPDNYFNSRFDNYDIHRLIIATNATRIANVLAANYPNFDQVTVVANSTYYGGSGGDDYATITAHSAANEILAHEMGHSFAGLADEYYAGDMYFTEDPNMTQQGNPALVKWKNWLEPDGDVDLFHYCCGGNSNLWYKPTDGTCKMELLGVSYCAVCKEAIIEKIHAMVNPIVSYTPTQLNLSSTSQFLDFSLTQLVKPIPNTLQIKWQLDAAVFDNNQESFQVNQLPLSIGMHTLSASVTDATTLVRTDNHALIHTNTITWAIDRTALGVNVSSFENRIAYRIFPNPSSNVVNIAIDLEKSSTVSIDIAAADGKIVQNIAAKKFEPGKHTDFVSIENLANGTYFVTIKIDGASYTKTLVKQ